VLRVAIRDEYDVVAREPAVLADAKAQIDLWTG
jgi:hypothetical protein